MPLQDFADFPQAGGDFTDSLSSDQCSAHACCVDGVVVDVGLALPTSAVVGDLDLIEPWQVGLKAVSQDIEEDPELASGWNHARAGLEQIYLFVISTSALERRGELEPNVLGDDRADVLYLQLQQPPWREVDDDEGAALVLT